MKLIELKEKLEIATASTRIRQVLFDVLAYANVVDKQYPIVIWNIDNSRVNKDIRTGSGTMRLDVICADNNPDIDIESDNSEKLRVYDQIEACLIEYLVAVNADPGIGVTNMGNVDIEYYPSGIISVDGEMAVKFTVTLSLTC